MADRRPRVSIIVVTMNTPGWTRACLNSVLQNTSVPYELIVVNNSRALKIRQCLMKFKGIRVIQNPRNLGYSKAANQGALAARGEFLCFLNSDTLVPPRWMERLLAAARKPKVGAVGPISQRGHRCYYRWPRPGVPANEVVTALADEAFERRERNRFEPVPFLFGFCLLIPRAVLEHIGLFDERFFFGFEDLDYCLRLRESGYSLLRVRSVFVHHQNRGSSQPERYRRLIQETEKQFVTKWRTLLGVRHSNFMRLYREQSRLKTPRQITTEPGSHSA